MHVVLEHVVGKCAGVSPRALDRPFHVWTCDAGVCNRPGVAPLGLLCWMRERTRDPVVRKTFGTREDLEAEHPEPISRIEWIVLIHVMSVLLVGYLHVHVQGALVGFKKKTRNEGIGMQKRRGGKVGLTHLHETGARDGLAN